MPCETVVDVRGFLLDQIEVSLLKPYLRSVAQIVINELMVGYVMVHGAVP